MQVEVEELGAGEALQAFGRLRTERERASRDIFVLAAHFADLYNVDSARGRLVRGPGGERAIRVAGDGAPLVLEFAIAEMAAELHMTTWSARRLIGEALETRHRLPRLWRRVHAGEVASWIAGKVAQATRELTPEQAGMVDAEVAEYADGRLPWWRFAELLAAKVVAADPDAAAERERLAAQKRFARVCRSTEHGQGSLYVKTTAAEIARIDATISYLAEALKTLGDPDNLDLRRTKAVLIMANPVQAIALIQALATHHSNATSNHESTGTGNGDGTSARDQDQGDDAGAGDAATPDTGAAAGSERGTPRPEPRPVPEPEPEADPASEDREDPREGAASDSDDAGPADSSASDPEPPTDDPVADDFWSGDPWAGTPRPANPWGGTPPAPPPDRPPSDTPPPDTPASAGAPPDTAPPDATPRDGGQDPPQPRPTDAFLTPFRAQDVPPCPCRGGSYPLDWAKLMPTVTLYLHLHADSITAGHGVARWEDLGPVTLQYIQQFLGPHCRFAVKPVIDPATLAPVDAYEIPERHREALHLRTPADVFPYAPNTGRGKQADHTKAYRPIPAGGPPGQTGLHNLGPMTGYHHRVKTHAGWRLEQPFPGIYLWMSPHGSVFLVDHTGTRQLRGPQTTTVPDSTGTPAERAPRPRHDRPSPLEDQLATLVAKAA